MNWNEPARTIACGSPRSSTPLISLFAGEQSRSRTAWSCCCRSTKENRNERRHPAEVGGGPPDRGPDHASWHASGGGYGLATRRENGSEQHSPARFRNHAHPGGGADGQGQL